MRLVLAALVLTTALQGVSLTFHRITLAAQRETLRLTEAEQARTADLLRQIKAEVEALIARCRP